MNELGGYRIIISELTPKVEDEVKLSYRRNLLSRLIAGKLNDIEITEKDAIFLWSYKHAYGNEEKVLMMNRSMYEKLKEATA
jgi:hypothetical protein